MSFLRLRPWRLGALPESRVILDCGQTSILHGCRVRFSSSLSNIGPAPGSTRQQNRVGRGPGSGRGKTSGRGQKGQKARHGVHPWFEGGQTPITRLFPKVGFTSKIPRPAEVNLGVIQRLISENKLDASKPITMKELYKARAVSGSKVKYGVKILARGAQALKQPITLSASKATQLAISSIEAQGGSFTAQYYTPLGVRAITRPESTLRKYARLPLRARPLDRRNIEYYRSEDHRGYLVGAPNPPQIKTSQKSKSRAENPLAGRLAELEQSDPSVSVRKGFELNGFI